MITTRLPLSGKHYPCLQVAWIQSHYGYQGIGKINIDGDTSEEKEWAIQVSQSMPIGLVTISIETHSTFSFEGVSVTERDLQWATVVLAVEIRRRKEKEDGFIGFSNYSG